VTRIHPAVVLVPMAAFAAAAMLTAQDLSRAPSRDRVDLAMVAKIRTEGTTRSKVLETFSYLTDVAGARPTGGRAHKQAADYVRTKLTEWGLANSHLEPFEFGRGWDLEKFSLELTAPRYFPMFGYPQAWTPSTRGVLAGAPIYVADKTEAEITALGEKLRGAIVLAAPPQTVFQLTDRLQPADTDQPVRIGGPEPPAVRQATSVVPANTMAPLLQKLGAGAILRPGTELHGTLTVGGSPQTPDGAVPTVIVMAEHYNMIVRMMPTRYAAVYAFFLESLDAASERLRNFVEKAAKATLVGDVFDDAATGQGLLNYFLRAINCGALTEEEAIHYSGLTIAELRSGSFVKILNNRQNL